MGTVEPSAKLIRKQYGGVSKWEIAIKRKQSEWRSHSTRIAEVLYGPRMRHVVPMSARGTQDIKQRRVAGMLSTSGTHSLLVPLPWVVFLHLPKRLTSRRLLSSRYDYATATATHVERLWRSDRLRTAKPSSKINSMNLILTHPQNGNPQAVRVPRELHKVVRGQKGER